MRCQMEAQTEEQAAETQKERKLRERNEQYSRQLEEELEGLKVSPQMHSTKTSVVSVLLHTIITLTCNARFQVSGSNS